MIAHDISMLGGEWRLKVIKIGREKQKMMRPKARKPQAKNAE
jgi:hypothetical protein